MKLRSSDYLGGIILGSILLHSLWVLIATLISSPLLPYPWQVYAEIPELFRKAIGEHLLVSLSRIAWGIALSLVMALPLAWLLVAYRRVGRMLEAFIYLSYPIPKLALLPIVMLFAGLGEGAKVVMIVLIILFQLVIGLRDSLKAIPQDNYALLRSLGAKPLSYIRHLYLPALMPDIFAALRIALGTAVSVLFVTETYGTSYGMGYYIVEAWLRVAYVEMYAGIVLLSLMGFVLFITIDLLEYLLCPWRRTL